MLCLVLYIVAFFLSVTSAQTCYYPNGNAASQEAVSPCANGASHCCPQDWICLNNGLCNLPSADYLGRYSCTDKTWKDPSCPNFCQSSNGSKDGNQAVQWCGGTKYCCDGNRLIHCCNHDDSEFFDLSPGLPMSTISGAERPLASSTPSRASTEINSPRKSAITTQSTQSTSQSPQSSESSSVSHGSSTSSSATPTSSQGGVNTTVGEQGHQSEGKSNINGIIVGAVVGPIGLLLAIGVVHFLLNKHRKGKYEEPSNNGDTKPDEDTGSPFSMGRGPLRFHRRLNNTASHTVSPTSPVSEIQGFPVVSQQAPVELLADAHHLAQGHYYNADYVRAATGVGSPPPGHARPYVPCSLFNDPQSLSYISANQTNVSNARPVSASSERYYARQSLPSALNSPLSDGFRDGTDASRRVSAVSLLMPSEQVQSSVGATSPNVVSAPGAVGWGGSTLGSLRIVEKSDGEHPGSQNGPAAGSSGPSESNDRTLHQDVYELPMR